jgi:hypothetical protein
VPLTEGQASSRSGTRESRVSPVREVVTEGVDRGRYAREDAAVEQES